MTYCEGKNCDKKEFCDRYVGTKSPSVIEQITDFSTSGSGSSNSSGVVVNPYCGLNSMYDYYIPRGYAFGNLNSPQNSIENNITITPMTMEWETKTNNLDKPVVITVPEKYVSKINDWEYGVDSDNIGEFSDGYHTFNELYHHRAILFAVICNQFKNLAWKSLNHSDNDEPMYEGMFVVGINTPQGPANYHYNINPYWDMFHCKELPNAPEWDGHTPDDAIKRIYSLVEDNKPLSTLEMMNIANKNGLTYYTNDMRYCVEKGFHESDGEPWSGEAFKTLNDLMNIDDWKILYEEN